METKEYTTIDRTALGWPSGQWDGEPDKKQWQDIDTGLPCLAVRHGTSGHWCGYVGVPEGHPFYGEGYEKPSVDVHWGLTYANKCQPHGDEESKGICHIPAPGEPDHVWWFGFDCAHSDDHSPSDAKRAEDGGIWRLSYNSQYRTLKFIETECKYLARQLKEAA